MNASSHPARRRRRRIRGPLGLLALLLLLVIATPSTMSLLPDDVPEIVITPEETAEVDGFSTKWNGLPLTPVERGADKLPDSF